MNKYKKGFTLIELLAVIVILALILLIAVPQITNQINRAKKDAFISTAKMILKQIDYDLASEDGTVEACNTNTPGTSADNCRKHYDLSTDYEISVSILEAEENAGKAEIVLTAATSGKFNGVIKEGDPITIEGTVSASASAANQITYIYDID